MGLRNQNFNTFRSFWLNGILVMIAIILNICYHSNIAEGKYSDEAKKKVNIVGEMNDLFANESSRSEPDLNQDYDYMNDPNHNRFGRRNHIKRNMIEPYVRRKSPGSVFIPVAAYSITKSKRKPPRASNGYRKRQGYPSQSFFIYFIHFFKHFINLFIK
jgi:hypothetical protein